MVFESCHDIIAYDARAQGFDRFSLETHGFRFLHHDFGDGLSVDGIKDATTGERTLRAYLYALEAVLKKELAADQVMLYDWRVRRPRSPNLRYSATWTDIGGAIFCRLEARSQTRRRGRPAGTSSSHPQRMSTPVMPTVLRDGLVSDVIEHIQTNLASVG